MSDVNAARDGDDALLLDLLDALVNERGRTAAAEALGVNYRTVVRCQQSRRMRQVLQEFRDSQGVGGDEPVIGAGDGDGEDTGETPEHRAAALEQENRELRETVEAQAEELEALRRRVAELGERPQTPGGADAVDGGRDSRGIGVRPGGATGYPMPVWSRWRSSPTRSTPSDRRSRSWPSGGGSGPDWEMGHRAAELTGPWQRCAGGNWRRRCCGTST